MKTTVPTEAGWPWTVRMSKRDGGDSDDESGTGTVTRTRPKTKRPSLYRVLLLNDDYTPMEFVVHVLERFFHKGPEEATTIMLHVHHNGVGECGVGIATCHLSREV
jgi:ATP-dependent Clp protease adaptor protein ClpS